MQDPHWFDRIGKSLARLDELETRTDRFRVGPRAGSPAARDATLRHGSYAWSLATAAAQVSLDHLRAWRHLHEQLQPPFAHWTLIRTAVEAAATVRWLCELGKDNRSRGIAAEIDDLSQRKGFEQRMRTRMSWAPGPKVAAPIRIAPLRQHGGRAMPGPTALAGMHLPAADIAGRRVDGEVLYRTLSAIAHAKLWAMPILSDTERGESVEVAPELAVTSVVAPGDIVWLVSDWAVSCLALAISDLEHYTAALVATDGSNAGERSPAPPVD